MNGVTAIRNCQLANKKLTKLEEEVIVSYILDLDSRGFSPRNADLEDMANCLLENYWAKRVRKN